MGRPKGSTNKKTANGGDGREITQHDNVKNIDDLTDGELQALTANNATEYQRLRDILTKASSAVQNQVKKAKVDGITLADMKAYLEGLTEEGQRRLREVAERAARMARWHSFELGTQASLFAGGAEPEDAAPKTNKSFKSGRDAGMIGAKPEAPNGFDPTEWMRGYHDGQAELGSAYKTLETPAPDADLH